MRKTDIRANASLPGRTMPEGGGLGRVSAGSLLHGAVNMQRTSPAGVDDSPGVVAIRNAALDHVGGYRREVDETFKEWIGATNTADVVRLVTMNVAGLCDDLSNAGQRMDKILTKLIVDENPDVLCFQEVTDEMYRVRSVRILNLFSSLERAIIPVFSFIPSLVIFQLDPSC